MKLWNSNPEDLIMNHQVVFDYIRYAFYHYTPSKPNQKKMKQLIESIPYFLPDQSQNSFYAWIRKYPIETYWDTNETMQEYGYLLYSFMLEKKGRIKTKKEYLEDLYTPPNSYQQKHSLVFFLVLVLLFYFLSRIK